MFEETTGGFDSPTEFKSSGTLIWEKETLASEDSEDPVTSKDLSALKPEFNNVLLLLS